MNVGWMPLCFSVYYDMIKDPQYYSQFKTRALAGDLLDLAQKYTILESLYVEARELGKFSNDDILLGIEDDIRLAAALNASLSNNPR